MQWQGYGIVSTVESTLAEIARHSRAFYFIEYIHIFYTINFVKINYSQSSFWGEVEVLMLWLELKLMRLWIVFTTERPAHGIIPCDVGKVLISRTSSTEPRACSCPYTSWPPPTGACFHCQKCTGQGSSLKIKLAFPESILTYYSMGELRDIFLHRERAENWIFYFFTAIGVPHMNFIISVLTQSFCGTTFLLDSAK